MEELETKVTNSLSNLEDEVKKSKTKYYPVTEQQLKSFRSNLDDARNYRSVLSESHKNILKNALDKKSINIPNLTGVKTYLETGYEDEKRRIEERRARYAPYCHGWHGIWGWTSGFCAGATVGMIVWMNENTSQFPWEEVINIVDYLLTAASVAAGVGLAKVAASTIGRLAVKSMAKVAVKGAVKVATKAAAAKAAGAAAMQTAKHVTQHVVQKAVTHGVTHAGKVMVTGKLGATIIGGGALAATGIGAAVSPNSKFSALSQQDEVNDSKKIYSL